jgi:hypothetical protein
MDTAYISAVAALAGSIIGGETKTAKSGSLCRSSTTRRGWTIMMRYLFERPNSVE